MPVTVANLPMFGQCGDVLVCGFAVSMCMLGGLVRCHVGVLYVQTLSVGCWGYCAQPHNFAGCLFFPSLQIGCLYDFV